MKYEFILTVDKQQDAMVTDLNRIYWLLADA